MSTETTPQPLDSDVPAHLRGFTVRARLGILIAATTIAAISLAATWLEVRSTSAQLRFDEDEARLLVGLFQDVLEQSAAPTVDPATPTDRGDGRLETLLFVHLFNVNAHLKTISNRHALGLEAIGCGVALLAMGLALFLIGADGAMKLRAAGAKGRGIFFETSAPGLACFAGSVTLIAIGATRPHKLSIGTFGPGVVREAADRDVQSQTDWTGDAYDMVLTGEDLQGAGSGQ